MDDPPAGTRASRIPGGSGRGCKGDGTPHAWGPTWNFVALAPETVTAYVVATVPAGRPNYFTRYEDAAAYVCRNVAPGGRGMVIIETATSIPATALRPACRTTVHVKPGGSGTVRPDGSGDIVVSGGALSFSGLEFAANTTLVGSQVEFIGNRVRGNLTLELVPPSAVPRITLAAAVPCPPGQTGHTSSNTIDGDVDVKIGDGNSVAEIVNNSAASVTVEVVRSDCVKVATEFNVTDRVNIKAHARVQSEASVTGHGHTDISMDLKGDGRAKLDLKENAGVTATIDAEVAEIEATVTDSRHQTVEKQIAASKTDITVKHADHQDYSVTIRPKPGPASFLPELHFDGEDFKVGRSHRFHLLDDMVQGECISATTIQTELLTGVPFSGKVGCRGSFTLRPRTVLSGGGEVEFAGKALFLEIDRVIARGDLRFDFPLYGPLGGYIAGQVSNLDLYKPPDDAKPSQLAFVGMGGLAAHFGRRPALVTALAGSPTPPQQSRIAVASNGNVPTAPGRLTIENVRVERDPRSQQPAVIVTGLSDRQVREVVLRGNTIDWANVFALDVSEMDVPVTIERNTITGGGIYLYGDVEGLTGAGPIRAPYVLRDNTLRPTVQGASGLMVSNLLNVTATGNRIEASPWGSITPDGTMAAMLQPNAYVRFDAGNRITGMVFLNAGSFARFQGNTFAAGYIADSPTISLVNDPVRSNSGLDPMLHIGSMADFDGNGCADYPTGFNEKRDGECGMPGLPPPSPPLP